MALFVPVSFLDLYAGPEIPNLLLKNRERGTYTGVTNP